MKAHRPIEGVVMPTRAHLLKPSVAESPTLQCIMYQELQTKPAVFILRVLNPHYRNPDHGCGALPCSDSKSTKGRRGDEQSTDGKTQDTETRLDAGRWAIIIVAVVVVRVSVAVVVVAAIFIVTV